MLKAHSTGTNTYVVAAVHIDPPIPLNPRAVLPQICSNEYISKSSTEEYLSLNLFGKSSLIAVNSFIFLYSLFMVFLYNLINHIFTFFNNFFCCPFFIVWKHIINRCISIIHIVPIMCIIPADKPTFFVNSFKGRF